MVRKLVVPSEDVYKSLDMMRESKNKGRKQESYNCVVKKLLNNYSTPQFIPIDDEDALRDRIFHLILEKNKIFEDYLPDDVRLAYGKLLFEQLYYEDMVRGDEN